MLPPLICVCRESPFASVDGRNLPPRPLGGWEEGHPHTRGASRHREPTRPRPFPRPMPTPRADTARGEVGQVPKRSRCKPTVAPPLAPATRADTASRPDQRTDRDPDRADTATDPTNGPTATPTRPTPRPCRPTPPTQPRPTEGQ